MDYKSHYSIERIWRFRVVAPADVGAIKVGAFGELFLEEVLRLTARAPTQSGLSPNFLRAGSVAGTRRP